MKRMTWVIEDHLCMKCGGRILRCVTGHGPTGGGNPVYRCADCGVSTSSMGPDSLCWCGFSHRTQRLSEYRCMPFSILEKHPELLSAFRSCGCEPEKGEVGILLESHLRELHKQQTKEG